MSYQTVGPVRRALYRAQTRLGLTGPEGTALLVVSLALAVGIALSEFREQRAQPLDPATFYAATDAAFAAASEPASARPAPDWAADTTRAEQAPPGAAPSDTASAVPRLAPSTAGGGVDMNQASADALTTLPGVGPAIAARIVEERERGAFRDLADFEQRVRGIGPKTAEKIAPAARF